MLVYMQLYAGLSDLRWSIVDCCSVIMLVRLCADVHVTACLSLPTDGVSFAVWVTTYLSWISLLLVCNTTGFLSLPHFPHSSIPQNSDCVFLSLLFYPSLSPVLLQLLCFVFEMYSTPGWRQNYTFTVSAHWLSNSAHCLSVCVCVCVLTFSVQFSLAFLSTS